MLLTNDFPRQLAFEAAQDDPETQAKLLVQEILTKHTPSWGLGPWGTTDTLYSREDWQKAAHFAALDRHYDHIIQMMDEEDGYQGCPRTSYGWERPWSDADMARVFGGAR